MRLVAAFKVDDLSSTRLEITAITELLERCQKKISLKRNQETLSAEVKKIRQAREADFAEGTYCNLTPG